MFPNLIVKTGILILALPAILLPLSALIYIFWQAAPALSFEFIFSVGEGESFGASTGIFAQLLGSLLLALSACVMAAPISFGTMIYFQLIASPKQKNVLETIFTVLQGIPPLVYGLFGLLLFVHLWQWGVSLAAGAGILAMVILPTLVLNGISALQRIPKDYTEAAQSLGLTENAVIMRVWLPQAWPGLLTGFLLAMARALSETAPILFTATVFSGVVWPQSVFEPVTTLQTHIFYLAQEGSNPQAISVAWASAAVLVMVVALFGLLTRWLSRLDKKHSLLLEKAHES